MNERVRLIAEKGRERERERVLRKKKIFSRKINAGNKIGLSSLH